MSETVGKAIKLTGGPEAEETSKFILMFDKFFDVLNVRSFVEGIKSRKPFLNPYRHGDDKRIDVSTIPIANKNITSHDFLQWLKNDFLPFLNGWEASVNARQGYSQAQKKRMLLS